MDLGLPSGTLWLDRLVGAYDAVSHGLYYQWGAINGHTASDGFAFNEQSYIQQGLKEINSNLSESQDAARAYYGDTARMPSREQFQELIRYCTQSAVDGGAIKFTSSINGNSIVIKAGGYIEETELKLNSEIRVWSRTFHDIGQAATLHASTTQMSIGLNQRHLGLNVMAVHV